MGGLELRDHRRDATKGGTFQAQKFGRWISFGKKIGRRSAVVGGRDTYAVFVSVLEYANEKYCVGCVLKRMNTNSGTGRLDQMVGPLNTALRH